MTCPSRLIALVALAVLLVGGSTGYGREPDEPTAEQETQIQKRYLTECRITQIKASISGKTSLTDDIGLRDEQGKVSAISGPFTFFTQADLVVGDMALHFDENGVLWDGEKMPNNKDQAKVLAMSSLLTLPGQEVQMRVGGLESFQYMRPVEGGRFELDSVDLDVGFNIELKVKPAGKGRVKLAPLVMKVSSVKGREPVKGVELNVGKPILGQEESLLELMLENGRPYAIQWRTNGRGMLLITLKVTEVEAVIPATSD